MGDMGIGLCHHIRVVVVVYRVRVPLTSKNWNCYCSFWEWKKAQMMQKITHAKTSSDCVTNTA
jgi:hypothetical protein